MIGPEGTTGNRDTIYIHSKRGAEEHWSYLTVNISVFSNENNIADLQSFVSDKEAAADLLNLGGDLNGTGADYPRLQADHLHRRPPTLVR